MKPSHALALACLFVDLHLRLARRRDDGGEKVDLLAELRQRGFARGDTEHMRLLMEALPHLMAPSRRTRSLARRPNFGEARHFYELVAPNYPHDPSALERFLADPERYLASQPVRREADGGGDLRRRRRRRRRRRSRSPGPPGASAYDGHAPAAAAAQHPEGGAVASDRATLGPSRPH